MGTLSGIQYQEILDEVHEIICKYSPLHTIIWTGDMNASTNRQKPNSNDRLFEHFRKDHELYVIPLTPDVPTFYHFNGVSSSQIDYAVIPHSCLHLVSKVLVM